MKKILLLILSVIVFYQAAQAEKLPLKGQIIYANDTVDVTFIIPFSEISGQINFIKLQQSVTYINSSNKKVKIKPTQAKEIRFKYGSGIQRMISVYNSISLGTLMEMDTCIFLKLNIDGNLKLFTYYAYGKYGVATSYIVKKTDAPIMAPDWISFRFDMKKYLSDCPVLVAKLEDKEYKARDLESIVMFYNNTCGKKTF